MEGRLRDLAPAPDTGLGRDVSLNLLFQAMNLSADEDIRIGRFIVRAKLGQGGMGTVYRAYDPNLQRDVALKVLNGTLDAERVDAVRKEARALARLAHPHVVTVYELGTEGDQLFVAMEYVPGDTMQTYVARERPDAQALLRLFIQAGLGIQAAHLAGLVHRDVKPENLLVHEDGRVLVADFGLARPTDTEAEAEIAGTPPYMAPEAIRGSAVEQSDQFAFCASLWRLLDPEAPLRSHEARIPVDIKAALTRGLAVESTARWTSMHELLSALSACLDRGPEARHRSVLLQRVERLWIHGVLRASLADVPSLDLTLSLATEQVEPPWDLGADEADQSYRSSALASLLEGGQGSLLLLGGPGAGKTTTLLQLAETLLEEARIDPSAPAPVVLLLPSLADHHGPVENWIEQEMVSKYGLPRRNIAPWIEGGALTLLLDGLDEIAAEGRDRCIEALNTFRAAHGLSMVVTCRLQDYGELESRLAFGNAVTIEPVALELVNPQLAAEGELAAGLRTPLMLSLMARSEGPRPEDAALLPWLYEQYLDYTLDRGGVAPTDRPELLAGLGHLAEAMTRSDRTELWLEQLEPGWLFADYRRYVAWALGVLLLSSICIGLNVVVGSAVEGDPLSGLILGSCSIPMILVLNGGLRIQPIEKLRFSGSRLIRLAPVGLALGLVAGAIYGMFYLLWVNIVFGAVAGLVIVFTVAFDPSFHESGVRPNQGIRRSLIHGLVIGGLGLVLGAVVLGYVTVPLVLPYLEAPSTLVDLPHPERSAAAVAGVMLGLIAGMVRGGWAVIMHAAVRIVLAATTPVPLRLVPFLNTATDLALLRRVGGGYLFVHRSFQRFLADRLRVGQAGSDPS